MEQQKEYKKIIDSLRLLSKTYNEQKESLPDFSDIMDDVTSMFRESFLLLPQLIESDYFSNKSIAWLIRTYNKMEWCVRNVDLDDGTNVEWEKLREFSKETLKYIEG